MKQIYLILIFAAVLCLAAAPALAAPPANTTAPARTVTDDYGTTVTITGTPERIVSLAPTNTEILFALGLGDKVVGVTDYCNYPPEALTKPKIGGFSTVSVEKVAAQHPDLVVASEGNGAELVDHLRKLNMTVMVTNPKNVSGILQDITLVGEAAGAGDNASARVASLTARIRATEANASALGAHPKVAHIIWNDPIYASGSGTFQDELISMAGGTNAFAGKTGYATIGTEEFIAANPDILIVNSGTGMGGSEDSVAQYFGNETRFAGISAIKNHRVYVIDSDTVDRAGPRVVDALEIIAADVRESDKTTAPGTPKPAAPGFGSLAAAGACLSALALFALREK
ncbi:cobalamin-binding protein [Methanoregula sp. UBA64]|uniref:cobalamin-binding protein n=1 Tax=Methanoregula sp. UBA64 TaxID=1915554 RepID=UPI0025F82364|nr:cobalamin-binding protein [Methanoregula sp. UBA64]